VSDPWPSAVASPLPRNVWRNRLKTSSPLWQAQKQYLQEQLFQFLGLQAATESV
jgi:hypothetical protein